jgi:hypothetical protein
LIETSTTIKEFDLKDNDIGSLTNQSLYSFGNALSQSKTLKIVSLWNLKLKDEGLNSVKEFSTNRMIEVLDLGSTLFLFHFLLLLFCLFIFFPFFFFIYFSLFCFSMQENQLTSTSAPILLSLLSGNMVLTELCLSENNLSDEGVQLLCKHLTQDYSFLKKLNLSGTFGMFNLTDFILFCFVYLSWLF